MGMKGLRQSTKRGGFLSNDTTVYRGQIASGYGTLIAHCDPVMRDNATKLFVRSDGTRVDAVFRGAVNQRPNGEIFQEKFWTPGVAYQQGADNTIIDVSPFDDTTEYEVVADGAVPMTAIGKLADLNTEVGNQLFGESLVTLKTSSIGAGTAVRIVGISGEVGNAWGRANTVLRVVQPAPVV